ncbi:MAG TPA: hypothetical protein VG722_10165 [Tepidisphaeraceae bacterium]|nr:hypothetical protein [Tepidisphaeraceae bacterium]
MIVSPMAIVLRMTEMPMQRIYTSFFSMRYMLLIFVGMMLVGCTTTYHFQVALKNETPEALTIGLASNGGSDAKWASPEQLAIMAPESTAQWGTVVLPGKTAMRVVDGKFSDNEAAFLRVYTNGNLKRVDFSNLLAISRGAPNRLDLRLYPGRNLFIIRDNRGVLEPLRHDQAEK